MLFRSLAVVFEIEKTWVNIKNKRIIIFAGKGNNGGDAFAVARLLFNRGAKVTVFITSQKQVVEGDSGTNLHIIEKMGIEIVELIDATQMEKLRNCLVTADIVVDGIFGTGLRGEVAGLNREIIQMMNEVGRYIIAIDIPSGTCGLTGKSLGITIKANKTVTFCLPKLGLLLQPGCQNAGEVVVANISIPQSVIEQFDIKVNLTDEERVTKIIPKRSSDSNKGDYGRAFIISGSVGMTGAGILSGGAALRSGCGLVYLGVPSLLTAIYETALAETITIPLEDDKQGVLSIKALKEILDRIEKMSVVAIGPGLSTGSDIYEIVSSLIKTIKVPLILDADALNVLAGRVEVLKEHSQEIIVTPHPGELSRLLGISIEEVQRNRIEIAREFAVQYNVIAVLKGARTIIADPMGNIYINPTGNSGMATAGTGDVLTGIITGFIAQGAKPIDAAVAGVYLHGLSGDYVAKLKGEHGMIAGDLIGELPLRMKELELKASMELN